MTAARPVGPFRPVHSRAHCEGMRDFELTRAARLQSHGLTDLAEAARTRAATWSARLANLPEDSR